jgi:hypothetical protein
MGLKNTRGQAATEMILLMVLGIAILSGVFAALKKANFIHTVAEQPFAVVSGMIECGVWVACGISAPAPNYHPSNRIISFRPQQ